MIVVDSNRLQLSDFLSLETGFKKRIPQQTLIVSNQVYHSIIRFRNLRSLSEFQFSVIDLIFLLIEIDFYR